MKKISAFTLLELLVGMVISSLLIGFTYIALNMLFKQFGQYKSNNTQVVELVEMEVVFSRDLLYASKAFIQNDSTVQLLRSNNYPITYLFGKSNVLRTVNGLVDSFKVSTIAFKPKMLIRNKALLQNLKVDVEFLGESKSLLFAKQYGADVWLND